MISYNCEFAGKQIIPEKKYDANPEGIDINHEEISFLNDVYIDSRYPADFGLLPSGKPGMEDAQEALRIAQKIDSCLRPIVNNRL